MTQAERDAIAPGDWVRFYLDGRLVIGEVQYRLPNSRIPYWPDELATDKGVVGVDAVLEVRKAVTK